MTRAQFSEFYLHHPEKLEDLNPERKKLFWEQRRWHPVVKMRWMAGITSNGEGLITYPDGSKHLYNGMTEIIKGNESALRNSR